MKKARKLGLQSLALVLMAFVLVAGVAFGMTGAWFTDKTDVTPTAINLGNQVKADLTGVNFADPEENSAHRIGASGAYQYLPGDTVVFSGTIEPDDASTSFYARMKVTVTANTTAEITFNSVTLELGDNDETVAVGDTWVYLAHEFIAGADVEFSGDILIKGLENDNDQIAAVIEVKVELEMIQSANITLDNAQATLNQWKAGGSNITSTTITARTHS